MPLRSYLLPAVIGLAALGALHSPVAKAGGYVSISVGTPAPYYGYGHRPGYVLVPGYWAATYRGRVWIPARYVWAPGGYGPGYGDGYGARVIYRVAPGGRYFHRGRHAHPPGYYWPPDRLRHPGW